MTRSNLWVITCYFNPLHSIRRFYNYRIFRSNIAIPTITVELGYGGKFELEKKDAEILVKIPGKHTMWQKERLLNIALNHLPKHVKYVAWIDSDIIFDRADWAKLVEKGLQNFPLIQVFSQVCRLARDVLPNDGNSECGQLKPSSACVAINSSMLTEKHFNPNLIRLHKGCVGFGWAARREILDKHLFYDTMIIGGGDFVMACAAYGWFEDAIRAAVMDSRRAIHYLNWANPFFEDVDGNVGYIKGRIFHLWHGEQANRRYRERHRILAKINFYPGTDIALTEEGCWALTGNNKELEGILNWYFNSRQEDG